MSSTIRPILGSRFTEGGGGGAELDADAVAAASVKHRTLREREFRLYSDAHVNKHSVDGEKKGRTRTMNMVCWLDAGMQRRDGPLGKSRYAQ